MRAFAIACVGLAVSAAAATGQGNGGKADRVLGAIGRVAAVGLRLAGQPHLSTTRRPTRTAGYTAQVSKILIDVTALANQVRNKGPKADLMFEYQSIENRVTKLVGLIDGLGDAYLPSKRNAKRCERPSTTCITLSSAATRLSRTRCCRRCSGRPAAGRRDAGAGAGGQDGPGRQGSADKALTTLDPLAKATADFGKLVGTSAGMWASLKTGFWGGEQARGTVRRGIEERAGR